MPTRSRRTDERWYASTAEETLEAFGVDAARGLSAEEVERRLREHGPNRLRETSTRPWWRVLLGQLKSIVVYLLGGAAVLAFATQRWPEGIAVVAVIAVNTAIGFVSEWKAVRSMGALRALGEHRTRVRRGGDEREIPAPEIVPGDIVLLEAGALVPADLRLVEADHLRVEEAALTGESTPADKIPDPVDEATELAERANMLHKGTTVADGTAVAIAVATGADTELGHILELADEAEATATPLQKRLDQLGRRLAWLTVGIGVAVAAIGLLVRHEEATLVVETALALGIAAIPEGLPIVATIALARGMYLMAKRNALVNRLTAVETLGATRVIFTDKTGTLTENRMQLARIATPTGELTLDDGNREGDVEDVRRAVEVAVLCNAASLEEEQGEDNPRGDPTEVALLEGGVALGIERASLLEQRPEARVEQFDPRVKMMATFHGRGDRAYVAVKGAPRAVVDACTHVAAAQRNAEDSPLDDDARQAWLDQAQLLAADGLRVLALADKRVESEDAEPYEDLCFVGLVGLFDPPREGVKGAIDQCQAAGIRVEMVTGDQPATGEAIAESVGIVGEAEDPDAVVMRGRELEHPDELAGRDVDAIHRANIFARVSPEQKLNLVGIYQQRGEIVAMTGDGINDAPALKKADIGVAMGRRGTEAAKQVADMVLGDDAFETIVAAVEQGRVIFANIRKSVIFMLCTNVAEIVAVTVATAAGWPLPLRPLQILYLNVLTDVFPALALGVGPRSGHEMEEPPRDPRESVLTRRHWAEIAGMAGVIAACVLGTLLLGMSWLRLGELEAVTLSFLTIAFGKLWLPFALRGPRSALLRNEVTKNPWVWGAIALCVLLLLGAVYLPGLSGLLQTRPPDAQGWALVLVASAVPMIVGQSVRWLQGRRLALTTPPGRPRTGTRCSGGGSPRRPARPTG